MIKFINHEHVMGLRGAGAGWRVIENKFEGGIENKFLER